MKYYCVNLKHDSSVRRIFPTKEKAEACVNEFGGDLYVYEEGPNTIPISRADYYKACTELYKELKIPIKDTYTIELVGWILNKLQKELGL